MRRHNIVAGLITSPCYLVPEFVHWSRRIPIDSHGTVSWLEIAFLRNLPVRLVLLINTNADFSVLHWWFLAFMAVLT